MEPSFTLKTGDARRLDWIGDESVHLVLTSPPYWTLKEYNEHPQQLGALADYQAFLDELDKVWSHCFRVLAKGGRLVCVVGDVCLSRRSNNGRHMVIPLHADISVRCRTIGFDYFGQAMPRPAGVYHGAGGIAEALPQPPHNSGRPSEPGLCPRRQKTGSFVGNGLARPPPGL